MTCEFLHALVGGPGTLEIRRHNISLLFSLQFELPSLLLPRLLLWIAHLSRVKGKRTVCRVLRVALVLELVVLVHELASVSMGLLEVTS